ncbi:MAG: DUF3159 domain-containing protein [Micromonosporaceae bacterium]
MSPDEIPATAAPQPGGVSQPGPGPGPGPEPRSDPVRQPGLAGQPGPAGQPRAAPQSASALLGMLGGKSGMLDSSIPGAIFVAVYVSTRRLAPPLWIATAVAGAILAYRLIMRDTPRHAVGGFFGVAIAAGLALLTGRPENYFVPTLVINAGYAVASAGSLAVRWPLVGLVLGAVFGEGTAWRGDAARRRAYTVVTALWLGMFMIRIAVLLPLWLAGLLVPLGIGRIVLGYPLYALVVWLTWLIVSRTRPVRPEPAAS